MGQATPPIDFTQLGRGDFFAALVVEELARAVPMLRRGLIP
jgi:hypothetical protein